MDDDRRHNQKRLLLGIGNPSLIGIDEARQLTLIQIAAAKCRPAIAI
jgi:hypothetical protein